MESAKPPFPPQLVGDNGLPWTKRSTRLLRSWLSPCVTTGCCRKECSSGFITTSLPTCLDPPGLATCAGDSNVTGEPHPMERLPTKLDPKAGDATGEPARSSVKSTSTL